LTHPLDKLVDGQVFRFNSLERCDVASEDVIDPLAGVGFFEAYEVFGLFYNAYQRLIPPWVRADLTDRLLGQIVTDFAAYSLIFEVSDGVRISRKPSAKGKTNW